MILLFRVNWMESERSDKNLYLSPRIFDNTSFIDKGVLERQHEPFQSRRGFGGSCVARFVHCIGPTALLVWAPSKRTKCVFIHRRYLYTLFCYVPKGLTHTPEINEAKAAAQRHRNYQLGVGVGAMVLMLCCLYQCWRYQKTADRRVRERRARRLLNSGGIS